MRGRRTLLQRQAVDALLLRFKTQGGKFPELARSLAATSGMFVIYPPNVLPAALGQARPGATRPQPIALDGPGGPLAAGFSHNAHAVAFAEAHGLCNARGISVTESRPWPEAIRGVLFAGFAGMLLDPGTPHMLTFQAPQLRKLYAYLCWDALVAARAVHVLWSGDAPFLRDRGRTRRRASASTREPRRRCAMPTGRAVKTCRSAWCRRDGRSSCSCART